MSRTKSEIDVIGRKMSLTDSIVQGNVVKKKSFYAQIFIFDRTRTLYIYI